MQFGRFQMTSTIAFLYSRYASVPLELFSDVFLDGREHERRSFWIGDNPFDGFRRQSADLVLVLDYRPCRSSVQSEGFCLLVERGATR